jgi:hypothetical protein
MKRTCIKCKAYKELATCKLGYKMTVTTGGDWHGGIENIKPTEICPKPLTKKELNRLIKQKEEWEGDIQDHTNLNVIFGRFFVK